MPPGKLGPRLVQDLLHYDPRHEPHARRNLLQDPPPQFEGDPEPPIPSHHCHHELALKPEQSSLSANGNGSSTSIRKVACFCTKCRVHIDIAVTTSTEGIDRPQPCHIRDSSRPLHHFCPAPELAFNEAGTPLGDTSVWRCSLSNCPVKLTIGFRLPRFTEHDIELMTDVEQLQKRWKRSHELSAGRADPDPARPVDALDFLVKYLSDSLQPTSGKNRIPVLNRKFLKTFGEDCDHILESLGFRQVSEKTEDGDEEPVRAWYIPNSSPEGEDRNMDHADIEDAIYELKAILNKYPMAQRTNLKSPQPNLKAALPSIQNLLGFPQVEYSPLLVPTSRHFRQEDLEHPYYAALGAVSELGDELLFFAFNAQVDSDPVNRAYYLECLKDIGMGRNSEKLTFDYQLLASKGYKTSGEIATACKELGLNQREMRELTEDEILGRFNARYDSSGPDAKLKLRQALDVIGTERDSGKLIRQASETIDTYEDALRFFDLSEAMNDEWVTVMYRQKCQDDPTNESTARKAVEIIAKHRKSDVLQSFLTTGELGAQEMEVSEAYEMLGVKDRSQAPDMDVLETQRDSLIADNPNNAEKLHKAFDLVRDDVTRNQTTSDSIQNGNGALQLAHSLETWPVGCRNLGNTCYLNSVLQFLFTIKPLRERVLHCDEFFQELSAGALENKRVGSKVTADMVEHGQKFVYQLRSLFDQMIFANADSVRPEMELACLALDKISVAEAAAATEAPQKPVEEEGSTVQGPDRFLITLGTEATAKSEDVPPRGNETKPAENNTSTHHVPKGLQENTPPYSDDNIMIDGYRPVDFNRSEIDALRGIGAGLDTRMDDASSTKAEHDNDASSTKTEPDNDASSTTMELDQDGDQQMEYVGTNANAGVPARELPELPALPSGKPPPVPPRPTQVLSRIEEAARQQDANDILLRIFDLFSYAFKGEGVMGDDGEQFDIIKKLFFLIVKEVNMSDGKAFEKRESCHHVVPGGHDRPLYEALEQSFQPEEDEQGKRYSYIEKAPPIMLVAIGRVEWKNNESVRDNSHLGLDEILYLDRYMGQTASMSHDKLQAKRQEFWDLQQKKHALVEKLNQNVVPDNGKEEIDNLSVPNALGITNKYITRMNATSPEKLIDVDDSSDSFPHFPDLPEALKDRRLELTQEYDSVMTELTALDTALTTHWTDLTEVPYRLHAIFMHRGSAAVGHYWIYIYDFQNKVWREYNDETVREVSPETVYAQHERASSTVVVYVRDEVKGKYTEAVCRRPGEGLERGGMGRDTSSSGDVEMTPPPEPEMLPTSGVGKEGGDVAMEDEGFVEGDEGHGRSDRAHPEPMSDVQVIEGVDPTRSTSGAGH